MRRAEEENVMVCAIGLAGSDPSSRGGYRGGPSGPSGGWGGWEGVAVSVDVHSSSTTVR